MPPDHKPRLTPGLFVGLVLVGFLLRGILPDRAAVEHFDEGVYAANLVAGDGYDFHYPSRHLFAPPLLPGMIEWLQVGLGVSDIASVVPNYLAGGLTVLLVGFVASRWFGKVAGLAAAALAALSGIHILYSRTALTDPLLCFWLLAAVYAMWCALADGDKISAVVAGVLTGLAWWTKYNGWLPLAIGSSAAVTWLLVLRDRRRVAGTLVCLLIMTTTACLVWLPVWYQLPDGYAAVAANHRQYLVGISGWPDSLWRQLLNHRLLDGFSGSMSLFVAVVISGFAIPNRRNFKLLGLAVGLCGLAAISTSSVVIAACGLIWMWRNVQLRPATSPAADAEADRQLALWLLIAWIGGLTLATPFYTPYPRITLPWLIPVWIAGGAGIAWFVSVWVGERDDSVQSLSAASSRTRTIAWSMLGTGLLLLVLGRIWNPGSPIVAWQDRRGMAQVASQVKSDIEQRLSELGVPRGADFVVDVYGEPSLYFQLRRSGVELALPASSLRFAQPDAPPPPYPTFLLSGPHAERSPQYAEQFQTAQPRLKLIKSYEYAPSDLVLLNDLPPREIRDAEGRSPLYQVQLYEVQ